MSRSSYLVLFIVICAVSVYIVSFSDILATEYRSEAADAIQQVISVPVLNKSDYNARTLRLAHFIAATSTTATTTESRPEQPKPISTATTSVRVPGRLWPVSTVYPNVGALLPFNRIVAYYGNFYSKNMGVLGEYPTSQLLTLLQSEVAKWQTADPTTPVMPAIQYIAVVAQGSAGKEGKYILRMPDDQIDHALDLAHQVHGIVILDIQVGKSSLQHELPMLETYLQMPEVHLAIDPEFSMKYGDPPGTVIGTYDATDINYAAQYLASLVRENRLPPKILVVHRFTQKMVTHYTNIQPLPEVQIVMDMDGWGTKAKKIGTYTNVVAPEPVQFTGIKLFYKNDLKPPSTGMLSTSEILNLTPAPIYIQYQ